MTGYVDEEHTWNRGDWEAAVEALRASIYGWAVAPWEEERLVHGWTDAEYAALERRIGHNVLGGSVAVLDWLETSHWDRDEALRSRVMGELFDGLRERGVTARTRWARVHGDQPLGAGALVALVETSHGFIRQLITMPGSRVRWPWRIQSEPWRPAGPDVFGVRAALSHALIDEWEGAAPAPRPTESGKLGWTIGWDAPSIVQGLAGGACPIDGTPPREPRVRLWESGRSAESIERFTMSPRGGSREYAEDLGLSRLGNPPAIIPDVHFTTPALNRAGRRKQQR